MSAKLLASVWYESFQRHAEDLYPGRYTMEHCLELAEIAEKIRALATAKDSTIAVHNYLPPEFHHIADLIGDSLGLARSIQAAGAPRVDFESVFFMATTAKLITGDATRVFACDTPEVLGCSLVFGTDYAWVKEWKAKNPGGVVVTYINCDAYTKSLADYVSTSRNTDRIIVDAARRFPGAKILVMPDKYLGFVMKQRALELAAADGLGEIDPDRIEVYAHKKVEIENIVPRRLKMWNASCYVHEDIGTGAVEQALDDYPEAELLIHPECGCASSCMLKLQQGIIPHSRAYFLSTEQMIGQAKRSSAKEFIVATEIGMIYRLRREMPDKIFRPVSLKATCRYMKANTFPKLLRSLEEDRVEIVICDDCCDPEHPHNDGTTLHIQRSTAAKAKTAIDRMMAIGA